MRGIERVWQTRGPIACLLWPVSLIYRSLLALRKRAYSIGVKKTGDVTLPVVVVGNLSVGGTGKTPLCLHLVEYFQAAGWRPAIVSRGYGGPPRELPHLLTDADTAKSAGDEPLMLYQQTGVPVCVCIDRNAAVMHLSTSTDADIVFSDDGLQHLAMPRVAEILVVDGVRGFGNSWLMPAGPLRNSLHRSDSFDVVAIQLAKLDSSSIIGSSDADADADADAGASASASASTSTSTSTSASTSTSEQVTVPPISAAVGLHKSLQQGAALKLIAQSADCQFLLGATHVIELATGKRKELSEFHGKVVHGVAGIGNPQRFFDSLIALGMQVEAHPMMDHHSYSPADVSFEDNHPVLVTSKDAVKLKSLGAGLDNVFEVCVRVRSTEALDVAIESLEQKLRAASGA